MKNTFGNSISVTLFGESHGEIIGATLDGMASGIPIDMKYIDKELEKRRPFGKISTSRVEADRYRIVSGVWNGFTTGAPITVLIENSNVKSADYSALQDCPRPSHADYAASMKYHGFEDKRGGGHFSGRLTAPLVAVGAIAKYTLERKGIRIGTHISALHGIEDRAFSDVSADISLLSDLRFPVLSEEKGALMLREIESAGAEGDSIGGILETAVIGIPAGIGEPFFDSIESVISHAMFSIPAVKGVEFGLGFGFAEVTGSEANDAFRVCDGKIVTATNHNGGINGGISNGMPLTFRIAVKPTPSISKTQKTVNIKTLEETDISIGGRHDPAIIHRLRACADSMTAIALCDLLALRFGTDYLQ